SRSRPSVLIAHLTEVRRPGPRSAHCLKNRHQRWRLQHYLLDSLGDPFSAVLVSRRRTFRGLVWYGGFFVTARALQSFGVLRGNLRGSWLQSCWQSPPRLTAAVRTSPLLD